jgi:hypothetical protein
MQVETMSAVQIHCTGFRVVREIFQAIRTFGRAFHRVRHEIVFAHGVLRSQHPRQTSEFIAVVKQLGNGSMTILERVDRLFRRSLCFDELPSEAVSFHCTQTECRCVPEHPFAHRSAVDWHRPLSPCQRFYRNSGHQTNSSFLFVLEVVIFWPTKQSNESRVFFLIANKILKTID